MGSFQPLLTYPFSTVVVRVLSPSVAQSIIVRLTRVDMMSVSGSLTADLLQVSKLLKTQ